MILRRFRLFAAVAVLLLAGVSADAFSDFLPHTDDGCPVEVHCLVCRRALGTTSIFSHAAPIVPRPERVHFVPAAVYRHVDVPPTRAVASRGPPSPLSAS
jgi:hypothetical protein